MTDGYILHFSDGTKAVIKNGKNGVNGTNGTNGKDGKDGKDGLNAPVIDVAQENGIYYWTITTDGVTNWLLDEEGNKLPVSGKDGENGENGEIGENGITPLLKIDVEGYWMVSYDQGTTYDYVLNADDNKVNAVGPKGETGAAGSNGATGDSKFLSVVDNGDGTVTITLTNNDVFTFAKVASVQFKIGDDVLTSTQGIALTAGTPLVLNYVVPDNFKNVAVEVVKEEGVAVSVDEIKKQITITGSEDGKAVILFYNANQTITTVLTFDSSGLPVVNQELQANKAEIDHAITISEISGANNVIKLPAASDKSTVRTFNIENVESGAKLIIEEHSDTGLYEGIVNINLNDQTLDELVVNLPGATVNLIGGTVTTATVTTSLNTFVVGAGAIVGTLTVKQGNVVIEAGATVNTIDNTLTDNTITAHVSKLDDLTAAIAKGYNVILDADITASDIIVINQPITLDGNGKKLMSTKTGEKARAINVSGANGVTIKNLTIEASGERAINIIQNANNVTIDHVTATAANYTVNVASSAPAANVVISNSTLTGLNVVNVCSAGADIKVSNSTINCNDNNTTEGEAYAALCSNKDAVGGKIVATGCTINVTQGSDSVKGRNGAEDGEVTIDGTTDGVVIITATVEYGTNYYHAFETLSEAIKFASDKTNCTVNLIRNVTLTETLEIPSGKTININLNGKTITIDAAGTDVIDFKNNGVLNIYGGSIVSVNEEASRRCIYNYGTMTIGQEGVENSGVTFTQTYELKGAAINNEGTMTIYNATVTAKAFSIWNSGTNARLEVKGGSYKTETTGTTGETAYYVVRNQNDANMLISGGEFEGNEGVISVIGGVVQLNDGKYTRTGIQGVSGHTIYVESGTLKYNPSTCDIINKNTSAGSQEIYKGTNGVVENLM